MLQVAAITTITHSDVVDEAKECKWSIVDLQRQPLKLNQDLCAADQTTTLEVIEE